MSWGERLFPEKSEQFSALSDMQLVARSPVLNGTISERPPVIAISGVNSKSKSVTAMMTMVRTLGATPVFIGNHKARVNDGVQKAATDILQLADAVIVMGNDGDIDPAKYGAKAEAETKVEQDTARAALEEELIRQSIGKKVPLLGICGGMQRINVICGGTLHQHVPKLIGSDVHDQSTLGIAPFLPSEEVNIRGGTALSALVGTGTDRSVMENSFHHQALHVVGEGLRVNAVSADGIAEGIETAPGGRFGGQFIMGMQSHPEFGAGEDGPLIVKGLVDAARRQSKLFPHAVDEMALEVEGMRSVLPDIEPTLAKGYAMTIAGYRAGKNITNSGLAV